MIKDLLVDMYKSAKCDNNLSYKEMSLISGLHEVQIAKILKHSANGVSAERMEVGLNKLGFEIKELVAIKHED